MTTFTAPDTRRADRARPSQVSRHYPAIRAALLTPDLRGQWGTVCCHGHREAWPSRAVAQIALRHAGDWCDLCAAACGDLEASDATP